ncbi:methyltransferase [Amycolatopsis nigrescens]|uniref:methyltransferase n=1 Tax=Amycolatopsis nigrescens TaxID=381445 RepID=UPI0003676C04|nr:methyltransferase [Amycolatopsis nigrescens]
MNELGYAVGRAALQRLSEVQDSTFSVLDLEWDQLAGVFGGDDDSHQATAYFTALLPFEEADSFLEMGCGSGVTAVVAALKGCPAVTALDINPAAAENTRLNAKRHGVEDRVRALTSDLFAALDEDETFDLIYWCSSFIEAPADRPAESFFELSIFDPGYSAHREFLRTAPTHLTENGMILLGFSNFAGNAELVEKFARDAGLRARVRSQQTYSFPASVLGTDPVFAAHADADGMLHSDFTLLEFRRKN